MRYPSDCPVFRCVGNSNDHWRGTLCQIVEVEVNGDFGFLAWHVCGDSHFGTVTDLRDVEPLTRAAQELLEHLQPLEYLLPTSPRFAIGSA